MNTTQQLNHMTTESTQESTIRTRFAPSPTGYLHLGGARTALYSWAFARHNQGQFILRVEDTDLERSTPEAVQAILDGMNWLGLACDEGPIFQTHRFNRYKAMLQTLLDQQLAYYCYCTQSELNQMREKQRKNNEKIRYDGTWRPEPGKTLPPIPNDIKPVIRFKNPKTGAVQWHDLVKGPITINNEELDDLIIARQDGTPTYNFCVVVDDLDMQISHVIRGDDHINNTPRQINILQALGGKLPVYGHIPMILGPDGEKLSKRHGAVSVIHYHEEGFLPEAMINYLARLGWGHGDDELFTREQLVEWFDSSNLSKSAAQFDPEKLKWVNAHYMKKADPKRLLSDLQTRLEKAGFDLGNGPELAKVLELVLERASTLVELRDEAALFYRQPVLEPAALEELKQMLSDNTVRQAILDFQVGLKALPSWQVEHISGLLKQTFKAHGLKMPKLAMPLRLLITGIKQTPSIDKVILLIGSEHVNQRLTDGLKLG